ncbi:MAG: hypothetical protein OXH47_10520, partial [Paracoccaceae bacterium]|nr:hypothetical protein [Paracoccaceae bacterium]
GKYPERILKNGQLPYKKINQGEFIVFRLMDGFLDVFGCQQAGTGNCSKNGRLFNASHIIYIKEYVLRYWQQENDYE